MRKVGSETLTLTGYNEDEKDWEGNWVISLTTLCQWMTEQEVWWIVLKINISKSYQRGELVESHDRPRTKGKLFFYYQYRI